MYRLAIFFICVFAPLSTQAQELIQSYSASYKLSTKNIDIGLIEQKLSIKEDGDYRFLSIVSTAGVGKLFSSLSRTQISTGKYIDGQFTPISYSLQAQREKRSYELEFDRPDIRTNNIDVKPLLTPTLFDELSYQAQLRADLLNEINNYAYRVKKKNKQKLYTFRHEKTELVATKLGKFICKKMVRVTNSSGKAVKIWLAENLNYIPVKIELLSKQKKTTAILIKFSQPN